MKVRVVVVGIPGVGKTTIVDKVHSMVKGSELITFGTVMLEEGMKRKWVKNRDELRKLPVEKQRRLQTMTASQIARRKDRVLLVDTHLIVRTKEGYWPGLPFEVVRALAPTHLVLIEAGSLDIAQRRMNDKTRYRDPTSQEELEAELALARSFLSVSSTLTGAPMLIVRNDSGRAEEVAAGLARTFEELSG